jgi:acyl carrier protein
MDTTTIKQSVKEFVLTEFLPGEDAAALTDDTEMFTQGILDSLASLKLVSFLEEKFGITIAAHEVDVEYLDSLDSIAALVRSKLD